MRAGFACAAAGLVILGCTPPARGPLSPERRDGATVFRLRAPAARLVQVSGTWDTNFHLRGRDATRFTRVGQLQDDDRDGTWELAVPLAPGRYEYLFLVDGQFWEIDPQNPDRVPDGQGAFVSLVIVP